ncbi:UNVERIFIED_CONTAM: hypothetical protein FKN15_012614 [Acipenser sinensis]
MAKKRAHWRHSLEELQIIGREARAVLGVKGGTKEKKIKEKKKEIISKYPKKQRQRERERVREILARVSL